MKASSLSCTDGILPFILSSQGVKKSPSLEDFYEILRLPLFRDGEVANIALSPDEAKAVKFLEDVVKKTLKKPFLMVTRKGKAPNEKVLENTSVGGDKGSRANFWGWIR